MPRIRSLKYEYFINEDLAQASLESRLLGLGLTTLADREGRLEDRPLRIKASLFPYHDVDVDSALSELATAGFLERYVVDGKRYIRIVNFLKHQKPHPREAESVIPSHEKVSPRRAKARPSLEKENKETLPDDVGREKEPPSRVVNGSGNGLGDLGSGSGNGSGDSAKAGASAAQASTEDFTIWNLGVKKIAAADGVTVQSARSFLGEQVKAYGKGAVGRAVTDALAQEAVEPKAYIVACLQGQNGARPGASKVDKSLAAVRQVIQEYEANEH